MRFLFHRTHWIPFAASTSKTRWEKGQNTMLRSRIEPFLISGRGSPTMVINKRKNNNMSQQVRKNFCIRYDLLTSNYGIHFLPENPWRTFTSERRSLPLTETWIGFRTQFLLINYINATSCRKWRHHQFPRLWSVIPSLVADYARWWSGGRSSIIIGISKLFVMQKFHLTCCFKFHHHVWVYFLLIVSVI